MIALKQTSPTTPSKRHVQLLQKPTNISFLPVGSTNALKNISKIPCLKSHTRFLKNKAGRNNQGRITVFTKGGGHKKKYRQISYSRTDLCGIVEFIENDPFRSSNIARIFSEKTKSHFYILAPKGLQRGHYISSQLNEADLNFKIGNLFYLKDLPLGVFVHNIFFPKKRGSVSRAAGCGAQIISKNETHCRLRLNSGELRLFTLNTEATLGIVSNTSHKLINLGKAGRSRWLNKRPSVRGVAMNPVDHPHGGGEGKTSGGRPSVTPWGKITKGQPTRKSKNLKLIVKRRK
jgi:large subunit ribosomal protein L2